MVCSDEVTGDPLRPRAFAHLAAGLGGDEPVLQHEAVAIARHAPARLDAHPMVAALLLDRLVPFHLGRDRIALRDPVDNLVLGQLTYPVRVDAVPAGIPQ